MAERKNKNDPGNYSSDLWGAEQKQSPRRKRKGKYGTISIGGNSFTQDALFQGEEIRIPFPNEPVNKIPDRLGMTRDPGTLFTLPVPEQQSTQAPLFIETTPDTGETQQKEKAQQKEPTRRRVPSDETTPNRQEHSLHAPDILEKRREADSKKLFGYIEKISRKTNHDMYDSFTTFLDVSLEATRRAMLFDIHWKPDLGEYAPAEEEFYKGYSVLMSNSAC